MGKEISRQMTKEIETLWEGVYELNEQRTKWELKYEQMMQLAFSICKTPEEIESLYQKIKSLPSSLSENFIDI